MTISKWLVAGLSALALAACSAGAKQAVAPDGDMVQGAAAAKVTLTEYGAPTCPGCKAFHDTVYVAIKSGYIDTGKIKFVWRELPSHNPPVDVAIFGIARCTGQKTFFDVIDEAYARQEKIEAASRSPGGARPALAELAAKFGVGEGQLESCIKDPKLFQRIDEVQKLATADGVTGTPTILIDGKLVDNNDYEKAKLAARLDAALAAAK